LLPHRFNHIAITPLNPDNCHSYEPNMRGQSPDVHRIAQLSRSSPWSLPGAASGRYSMSKVSRPLPRHLARSIRRQQGALQFSGNEKMKGLAFGRRRRRVANLGHAWMIDDKKPSNTSHTAMSGASKFGAFMYNVPVPSHPLTHIGRLGAVALASSYDHVHDRAYMDPRGRHRVLSRPHYKSREGAPGDLRHVRCA
jgi:hypothetical protein